MSLPDEKISIIQHFDNIDSILYAGSDEIIKQYWEILDYDVISRKVISGSILLCMHII